MTDTNEPQDPCREALRRVADSADRVDIDLHDDPSKCSRIVGSRTWRHVERALASPNPLPELVTALEDLLNDAYHGNGLCTPTWDTVEPAREQLRKWREA